MISDATGIILIFILPTILVVGRFLLSKYKLQKINLPFDLLIGLFIIIFAAGLLLAMGRLPWCECGEIWLWSGDILTEHNSQHISDPYTFTHFIHGLAFYLLLWIFARKLPFGIKLLIAVSLESAWEVIENTDMVIEYYRANTISLGYYGDSVINSVSDIVVMALGFWFATRFPKWISIASFIAIELFLAFWIKDNLTLNIVMFIYPFEFIKNWQLGV